METAAGAISEGKVSMNKAKSIAFNTEDIRAILDGRKTVTRRVIKPHYRGNDYGWQIIRNSVSNEIIRVEYYDDWEEFTRIMEPPYQPGDTMYVKEQFYKDINRFMYKADYFNKKKFYRGGNEVTIKWQPSIRMSEDDARIWLKMTDVRVERLQDINYFDCINEGIPYKQYEKDIIKDFSALWDSTIKKSDLDRYGWEANPWVWRISFERCGKPESEG